MLKSVPIVLKFDPLYYLKGWIATLTQTNLTQKYRKKLKITNKYPKVPKITKEYSKVHKSEGVHSFFHMGDHKSNQKYSK